MRLSACRSIRERERGGSWRTINHAGSTVAAREEGGGREKERKKEKRRERLWLDTEGGGGGWKKRKKGGDGIGEYRSFVYIPLPTVQYTVRLCRKET